jgi:hypothetical protein
MMERFQKMAGVWQVRGGTGTGFYFVLNSIFALKRSQLTGTGFYFPLVSTVAVQ